MAVGKDCWEVRRGDSQEHKELQEHQIKGNHKTTSSHATLTTPNLHRLGYNCTLNLISKQFFHLALLYIVTVHHSC